MRVGGRGNDLGRRLQRGLVRRWLSAVHEPGPNGALFRHRNHGDGDRARRQYVGFSNCATLSAAPNVFTVDTTGDGETACLPGFCSFRDAINAVNGYAGASATIKFAISGGWPQTISLLTALPPITTPVSIDGTTETGTPANTPG